LSQWLRDKEKQFLVRQLEIFEGKVAVTARHCGLGIRTLSRKMRIYGLDKIEFQKKRSPGFLPVAEEKTKNHRASPPHLRDS
jgi:hypothetical protein